jgi:hypothetical protein
MAVEVGGYGRGGRTASTADKERRQKIVLGVCAGVLVLLLALEGPKTLKQLRGGSTAAPVAAPAPAPAPVPAPATPGTAAPAAVPHHPVDLARIRSFPAKDPFVAQVGGKGFAALSTVPAAGPAVRSSHFVPKDPFVAQLTAGGSAAAGGKDGGGTGVGGTGSTAGGKTGYIVVLASIAVDRGRLVAAHAAAKARGDGLKDAAVVVSSGYPTLRSGFFAVYTGTYGSLEQAHKALEQARAHGYVTAYTRRLAR